MENKIKILFHTVDVAGVNYFRILTPAMELERNHSDKFQVEINPQLDFNNPNILEYLKSFDIIHYHRQLVDDVKLMSEIAIELKKSGVTLIVDIDDYWNLHQEHPMYALSQERKLHIPIIENLKIADYVTTTSELFAEEIRKITGKNNVEVLYNSVDPIRMKQFQNNWKPDPDGRVRITYAGGSSHAGDIKQLEGVMNILSTDWQLKDKFKVIVAGWDTQGTTTDITLNQEFEKELQLRGLWNHSTIKAINRSRGDITKIPNLPNDLIVKYRNKVFIQNQRDIKSDESVYYMYEKTLTDNHKMIKNPDYLQWLMNFERNVAYSNEGNYARRWTQKANTYAQVLDETDIVIAPLSNFKFNHMKSCLKQVECWSRKLPIVCSDIPPYNVHGKHMENCVLIPSKKDAYKDWAKYLKKLILDADLRKRLGENLYNDFSEEYNLINVTNKRAEFYSEVIKK